VAPLAFNIQLHILTGQLHLQLAHFKGQFLLSLTQAKENGVIPREGLLPQKKKGNEKKSKRSQNAKNKKQKDAYLKLLSKRSRSS
jgi:hypothetical protein